jgi:hypothetical protein
MNGTAVRKIETAMEWMTARKAPAREPELALGSVVRLDYSLALDCLRSLGLGRLWLPDGSQQLPLVLLLAPLRAASSAHLRRLGFPKKMLTLTPKAFVEVAHWLRHAYLIRIGQNSTPFSTSRA